MCQDLVITIGHAFKLKFTTETKRTSRALDFQVWRHVDGQFLYMYKKEVGSRYCLHGESAAGLDVKKNSLIQEVVRRQPTTSEEFDTQVREQIIKKFTDKLRRSRWSWLECIEIVEGGIVKYGRIQKRCVEMEGRMIHRTGRSTVVQRYRKKRISKNNW